MKKFFLAAVLMLVYSATANAQSYGFKAGVNFANLTGNDSDGFDGLTGYHVGLIGEFSIFSNLSLQPELVYSVQGAKLQDVDYKLGYVTLPVLAKFYLNDKLSVHAGPQFALLVSENDEVENVDSNSLDYGWAAGIEYIIAGGFFIQGRYNSSISEVSDNADLKNSVIQLSLGYQF